MGKMSELAADVEKAAMVIANDNYDLRTQLQQMQERIDYLQKRNFSLFKDLQRANQRFYELAAECGITIGDDE